MTADALQAIPPTDFAAEGIWERRDLQRLLGDNITAIDESLLVIAEEFGDFEGSDRRIDLLCIDRDARVVVVELKRTYHGGHMDLQALRYAVMVSSLVVEWVIAVVMSKSTEDKRVEALNALGWAWADVRGARPWGFDGAVPNEDALTNPGDAKDDETKYAVLRNATMRDLRYDVEVLKAKNEMLQRGRHFNLAEDAEEIADLRACIALMEQAKNEAERRRAKAEYLVARVRQRNNELERVNVEANHKFEHLLALWQQRRTSSLAPISGTLDTTPATEQTAVFLAVPAHQPVEALDPGADTNNEIDQQRYKHNAWRPPELESIANDSRVETMLMEIGEILSFRVPGDLRDEASPHDEPDMPSASTGLGT